MNNTDRKNEEDILIIECELPDTIAGQYFIESPLVFIKSINDKSTLIHEHIHHCWHTKNRNIQKLLKNLGLDFNTKPKKAMSNKLINECLNVDMLKKYYKPNDWLNEALAYILQDAPEDLIRAMNIPLLNRILDDDFYYYNGTNGDLIYYKTGEVVGNNKEQIERIVNFLKED